MHRANVGQARSAAEEIRTAFESLKEKNDTFLMAQQHYDLTKFEQGLEQLNEFLENSGPKVNFKIKKLLLKIYIILLNFEFFWDLNQYLNFFYEYVGFFRSISCNNLRRWIQINISLIRLKTLLN